MAEQRVRDRSRWGRPSEQASEEKASEAPRGRERLREREQTTSRPESGADGRHLGAGWGAWDSSRTSGNYVRSFRAGDDKQIIRFLDDGPYAVFDRHWWEKKPYQCAGPRECALCNLLGDKPRQTAAFNVAVAQANGSWELQSWEAAGRVTKQIQSLADKPLDDPQRYFWVQKSGTNQSTVYSINEIKARDLEDDWGVQPLSADEIEGMAESAQTVEDVRYPDQDDLERTIRSKMGSRDY